MFNNGASSFYGFTNGSTITSIADAELYMDFYTANAGSGGVPSIVTLSIPQSSGGNDSFGNSIVQYNFTTIEISSGTVSDDAYYTFFIPAESIGGASTTNRQTKIDVSDGDGQNTFTTSNMPSSLYNLGTITNPGGSYDNGTYRVYTTNTTGGGFYYDNTSTTLYFKGNTVA